LHSNFVWHRRNVYNALLLAWSRCPVPAAPEACDAWLSTMKAEEAKYRYQSRLVNVHAYNYVLASHAIRPNTARVEELWSEMTSSSFIQPNAQSYDALIKAYQRLSNAGSESGGNSRIRVREIFREQLRVYRSLQVKKISTRPMPLTLARVLSLHTYAPDEARAMLDAALELEQDRPECRGLANIRHVALVLNALTGEDRVEEAERLLSNIIRLYETDSNRHLRPDKKVFGIVMDGYAKRGNGLESLEKVEAILANLEDRLVKSHTPATQHFDDDMDATVYNILMTAYFRAWPNDAVNKIQLVIERMERVAKQVNKETLLPDSISYTILIKALGRRAAPGYEHEVESVLSGMEQQPRPAAKPKMNAYCEALRSWAHSANPNASARVRDMLNAIESPTTVCFNIALGAYGRRGEVDEVMATLRRMKDDSESGRNRLCQPDTLTYTSVLLALTKPARVSSINRWEKALECFDDMSDSFLKGDDRCRPNQKCIGALLEVLRTSDEAREKHVAAQDLLKRLGRLGLPQGRTTAVAIISACGGTIGSKEVRLESTTFIISLIKSLPRAHLSDETYRAALESCHRLLFDDEDDRVRVVSRVFVMCKDSGHVSMPVLETLRSICPSDVYTSITSQNSRATPTSESVPKEWTKHA
jgi:pentatricopeptide repeat protein